MSERVSDRLIEKGIDFPWWEDYKYCRSIGLDWRKAVWVAWKASPVGGRSPATQEALATEVLGLASDRVISSWLKRRPELDDLVAQLQAGPLMKYRRDVFETLATSATMLDPRHSTDRRTFLQMTGDLKTSSSHEISGPHGGPVEVGLNADQFAALMGEAQSQAAEIEEEALAWDPDQARDDGST